MSEHAIQLTSDNFNELTLKGNWVIDFWAEWCMPCKMMSSIFEEAAKEFKGKVKFGKINVDEESDLAQKFEIMGIPAVIFLKNKKEVNRVIGLMQKSELIDTLESIFKDRL